MSGKVAVSKLRLMKLVTESAISLTQSFKSLTGTLSRPVALVEDIKFICFLTRQLVSGGILKSSPDDLTNKRPQFLKTRRTLEAFINVLLRDIHKCQIECFSHLIWIRRQLVVLNLKGNVLLHILYFNERVQKVSVDSWIVNIVINCSFEEIGFRRSDFIVCCIPAYFDTVSSLHQFSSFLPFCFL